MIYFLSLASTTELNALEGGRMIGAILAVVALVLGIIKCAYVLARATASKFCLAGLLVLLVGYLVSGVGNLLGLFFESAKAPLTAVTGVLALLFAIAGIVLAIVGLATYDRSRHRQGKAQAVWTLVLGGLSAVARVTVLVLSLVNATKEGNDIVTSGGQGSKVTKQEFNFSIDPGSRWVTMKPEALNKLACAAFRHRDPEMFGIIIAERVGFGLELEQLKELCASNLASAATVLSRSDETVDLNGLKFAHVSSKVITKAAPIMTIDYEHWVATKNGFSWQCIFWGKHQEDRSIAREALQAIRSFHLLDPEMDAIAKEAVADVRRPEWGYHTNLKGMGWSNWTDSEGSALVDFRAQRKNEALIVLPLRFDGEAPDMAAIGRGLRGALQMEETPEEDFEHHPWKPDSGAAGEEWQIEREISGNRYHYILRIARGENSAHLIAGWAVVSKGDLDLVRRSLDAITLEKPTGPIPGLDSPKKKAFGLLLNATGIALNRRGNFKEAAKWFMVGYEAGGDPTILGNAGDALEHAGEPEKGRDLLTVQMAKFPRHTYLGLRYARLQALSGDAEAGADTFLALLKEGLKNDDDLLSWLTLLRKLETYPAAIRSADAWVEKQPTVNSRRWRAQIYGASGAFEAAVSQLEKLHEENPVTVSVSLDLGNAYNDAGEHAKAEAVARSLLATTKDSPRALSLLGWSQMGRKWYRDAKATFELAAKKSPEDQDLQDAIRRASSAMGQGDNTVLKEPIEPVPVPAPVTAALAEWKTGAEFGDGHPAAWTERVVGYQFAVGKATKKTIRRSVKVLTAEGAKEFSSVEIRFEPVGERIFMNRLEVKDEKGASIAKASIEDAYIRDLNDGTASHSKVLHMQVAGVRPGATVEWEVTIEDRGTSDTFEFQRHLFANGLPSAREAVFVSGDVGSIKSQLAQGTAVKTLKTKDLIAWIVAPQEAAPAEPAAVLPETRAPMLWLCGDEGSWAKVAQTYLKQVDDRLQPDKSIEELAARLTAGMKTEHDKIAAITKHVQQEIGYKAIEFGVRARRPNAASETLRLHYGDCKDTALLVHLLFRAVGIQSHLALINTQWRLRPDLPTLDQFNHMVVSVPSLGAGWLVDGTDKCLSAADFSADNLWHAQALVLDPKDPRLITPPSSALPAGCRVLSQRTIGVEGSDWKVHETLTLDGYYASWMRSAFIGLSKAEQRDKAQRHLASMGNAAQLKEFQFENLDNVGESARLVLDYTMRDGIGFTKGQHSAPLPALWERDYLGTSFVKDRKTEFEWNYPLHFLSEVTVTTPVSLEQETVEALTKQGRSEYCAWSLTPKRRQNELSLRFEFEGKAGRRPATSYAAFHDAWEEARRAWEKPLTWSGK